MGRWTDGHHSRHCQSFLELSDMGTKVLGQMPYIKSKSDFILHHHYQPKEKHEMKHFALLSLLASLLFTASCVTKVVAPQNPTLAVTNQHYGIMGTMTADLNCNVFEADKAIRNAGKAMQLLLL